MQGVETVSNRLQSLGIAMSRAVKIPLKVRRLAKTYLHELESGYLDVCLAPAPEPNHGMHQIRVVQFQNARWYRDYCEENVSCTGRRKRPRTFIKRRDTIRHLGWIIEGRVGGFACERLLEFIRRRANMKHGSVDPDFPF